MLASVRRIEMNIPFMKWLLDMHLVKRDMLGMPMMNTVAAPYERLMKIYRVLQGWETK